MIPLSQFYEEVSIVKMVVEDISEVQLIEKEENLAPWSFEGYSSEIENLDSFCLIAQFKNEIIGSYQLHKTKYSVKQSFKMLLASIFTISKNYFIDLFYTMKKFLYVLNFLLNKPKQF